MFLEIETTQPLKIPPNYLSLPIAEAIQIAIAAEFVGKMIDEQGIAVCINDVVDSTQPQVRGQYLQLQATFMVTIFRPFRGERIWATISQLSDAGITLNTPFCVVTVPFANLFDNSFYSEDDKCVVWRFNEIENQFIANEKCFVEVIQIIVRGERMEIVGAMNQAGFGCEAWW